MSAELTDIIAAIAATTAVAFAAASLAAALKSGVLKSLKLGPIEIETAGLITAEEYKNANRPTTPETEPIRSIGFEIAQLERYYSQILSQSKVSFWFSLIFASLGFAVIIGAAILHRPEAIGSTVTQVIAGIVMDAVSSLFFVQSRRAHEAMAGFFEKLRKDRLHSESRRLCDEMTDPNLKDALRVQLVLHYAELPESAAIADRLIQIAQK